MKIEMKSILRRYLLFYSRKTDLDVIGKTWIPDLIADKRNVEVQDNRVIFKYKIDDADVT